MNITRTAKFVNGKMVYDPPYTAEELRLQKQKFAEMCQARRAPMMGGSERALMEGDVLNHGLSGEHPGVAAQYIAKAKYAGIDITGKVYKGGLADGRGPGDPDAWVSGVDDVLRVAKKKNKNLTGVINYRAVEMPPPPDVPLSDQAIAEIAPVYLQRHPDFKGDIRDLKAAVTEEHGAPVRKQKKRFTKAQLAKLDAMPPLDVIANGND